MQDQPLYTSIIREVCVEAGWNFIEEFRAGEICDLPNHLICTNDEVLCAVDTDITVHLWDDAARVAIFREWEYDTARIGTIGYGPSFGDDLRALVEHVNSVLDSFPTPRAAIEYLIAEAE